MLWPTPGTRRCERGPLKRWACCDAGAGGRTPSSAPSKVMVGTVNASRENFENGVRDMSQAEAEYPGWLRRLLTESYGEDPVVWLAVRQSPQRAPEIGRAHV